MIKGDIVSVLSSSAESAALIASKLGKKHESDGLSIYYRKKEALIRSVLVSSPPYPEKVLAAAQALTLSSTFLFAPNPELSWSDGELGLLLESSGLRGTIITDREEDVRRTFQGLAISLMDMRGDIEGYEGPVDAQAQAQAQVQEGGYVYLDRVFLVKGVGTVALGFSFTELAVHDRLLTLPLRKEVEVRSIQVLDEDQDRVGRGVRVGLALKNVEMNEVKDIYALVRPGIRTVKSLHGAIRTFPWAQVGEGQLHVVSGGITSPCEAKRDGDGEGVYRLELNREVPLLPRYVVLNLNAKPGKSRVVGPLLVG